MTPERWQEIQAVFHEVLKIQGGDRMKYLAERCAGDSDLREEVEKLLDADESPASVFRATPTDLVEAADLDTGSSDESADESLEGEQIGPYKIVRQIGQGGMGTVFLAERSDGQFTRQAAIKVVKRGMDTDEILRRFRYERQILAGLQHPNIASLLDGGVTPDGRPYLVMEYVDGEPIDRYCKSREATISQRLSLFRTVCEAVQYAHRNLVVHRDLKPSNILVTGDGTVKLLDFGIAKLLTDEAVDFTAPETKTGVRVMTPEYASPEQMRREAVTTATDVYALGVVLYELATGVRPHDFTGLTPSQVERLILEDEPRRPSTAVTEAVAKKRLGGDLDTIILKALRKEPARRYASVEAFAEDIRRHVSGLPVHARPDNAAYRLQKFVERHRYGVAAAAVFAILLVGFAVAMTLQQAATARERDRAAQERDKAEEVAVFLQKLFDASDPFLAEGELLDTMRVRAFLDRGATRIERELGDQPEVLAQMLRVIGDVYQSLGLYDRSDTLLVRSLDERRVINGDGHPDVAESLESLGRLRLAEGKYQQAEEHFREALAIRKATSDVSTEQAGALEGLATAIRNQGDLDEAERLITEALNIRRANGAGDGLDLAATTLELGRVYQDRGNLAEAESLFRQVLALHRHLLGEHDIQVAATIDNLAVVLRQETKLEEAEPLTQEALALRRRILGPKHPQTLSSLYEVASIARERGKYDEAVERFEEVIALDREVLGDRHHYVGLDYRELGITLSRMGAYEEALEAYQTSLSILRETLSDDHQDVTGVTVGIGNVYLKMGDPERAEPILKEALEMRLRTLGEESWQTGVSQSVLGECLMAQGRLDEAEAYLLEGFETLRDAQGPTEAALRRLVAFYELRGDEERASEYRNLAPPYEGS